MDTSYYYLDKEQLFKLLKGLEEVYRRRNDNDFEEINVDDLIADTIEVSNTVTVGRNPQVNMEVATKLYVDNLIGSSQVAHIEYDTVAGWNAKPTLTSKLGTVYVYTDYKTILDLQGGVINIPAIKIGDGNAFLIDLPFMGGNEDEFLQHINNNQIHITQAEREFWNSKVRPVVTQESNERLILTIN